MKCPNCGETFSSPDIHVCDCPHCRIHEECPTCHDSVDDVDIYEEGDLEMAPITIIEVLTKCPTCNLDVIHEPGHLCKTCSFASETIIEE